jgi:tetratricopeptide (TPR) repeat protein
MAKEPEGRYATAQELADDLGRFLADEPIRARRPSPAERLAKWAKRHRVALASATAALMVAMAVGSVLLWSQQRQTTREKERTWRAYEQNRKILDLVFSRQEQVTMKAMGLITQANMKGLGDDGAYVKMVRDFYQDMINQAGDDPDMAELKARSYHMVGFCRMVLGDLAGADDGFRRAIRLFEGLLARGAANPTLTWLLASTLDQRGLVLRHIGRKAESESDYRRATALRLEAATRFAPDAEGMGSLAWSHLELAGYLDEDRRPAEAEAARKQLTDYYRSRVLTLPGRPADRQAYAQVHARYGAEWLQKKPPSRRNAEVMFELARMFDPDGPVTLNDIAWGLARQPGSPPGDLARALGYATKAVEDSPTSGDLWNTLGVVRYRRGDWKGAIEALEKSMKLRDGGDPNDWYFLAMARHRLGDPEGARRWFEKAAAWLEERAPDDEDLKRFHSEAEALLRPGAAKP